MMTCHDDLLQLYIDEALHPAEAAILEAHLKDCAACRRRAGLYKSLYWDLAHAGRSAPAPAEADGDALAALLRAEWQRTHTGPERSTAQLATLFLTANPVVTGAARGLAGLLFRRKGGGGR